MRFSQNIAFGLFSVALMGVGKTVLADEIDDAFSDTEPSSGFVIQDNKKTASKVSSIVKPTFSPLVDIDAPFFEQFIDDSRWNVSRAVDKNSAEAERVYNGNWTVEVPIGLKGIEGDRGLVMKNAAARHGISAKLKEPLKNNGKDLVVQYEVMFQNGLECGGAYLKLLEDDPNLRAEEFSSASPYVIMFGPDKCGSTNKVHFIFRHKNKKTGEYEEKHMKAPPMAKITKKTALYTLIVKKDQTFEIRIDGVNAKSGSLLEDFEPAVNPPKEIEDPNDKKPSDWVEKVKIPDPSATKPDDWNEEAPAEIIDESAEMPKDWLVDEPEYIPDPDAEKPEDWDDAEDGEWEPTKILNPKCDDVSGCGIWSKPMKPNPEYKGKWIPPMIDNPDYKGPWSPRKIPNPNYYEDKTPSNFEPIGAVGFELWTMTKDILFDNIYIGHSIKDAEKIQKATFDIKSKYETQEEELSAPKPAEPTAEASGFAQDPISFLKSKLGPFMAIAQKDPVGAFKEYPHIGGSIIALVVTIFSILAGLISLASAPSKVKVKPTEAKNKIKAKAEEVGEKAKEVASKVQEVAMASKSESSSSESDKPKATRRTSKKA